MAHAAHRARRGAPRVSSSTRMPAAAQSARTRRRVADAVAARRREDAAAILEEVALGRGGAGLLGAGDRMAAAEPTGGRSERARDGGDDGAFTLPASVMTAVGRQRSASVATRGAIVPTGVAEYDQVDVATGPRRDRARRDRSRRGGARRARFSGERPSPTISPTTPRSRSARPSEPPIRPTPAISSRSATRVTAPPCPGPPRATRRSARSRPACRR